MHNLRNLVECCFNGAGSIVMNKLAHSKEFKETLESMAYSVSSKEAFADSLNKTFMDGIKTLENLGTNTNYNALDNILYAISAGMLITAGYRAFNVFDRLAINADPIRKIRDMYVEKKTYKKEKAKRK